MTKPHTVIIKTLEDWHNFVSKVKPFVEQKPFKVTATTELKRTLCQNALFHAWLSDATKVFNEAKGLKRATKEIKAYCKDKLGIKAVIVGLDEQPIIEVVSTADYSTKELSEFIEKITAHFLQEFNVELPEPKRKEDD